MKEPTQKYTDCNSESWQCLLWFHGVPKYLSNRVAWFYVEKETSEHMKERQNINGG